MDATENARVGQRELMRLVDSSHAAIVEERLRIIAENHGTRIDGYRPLRDYGTGELVRVAGSLPSHSSYQSIVAIELILRSEQGCADDMRVMLHSLVTSDGCEMRSWPRDRNVGDTIAAELTKNERDGGGVFDVCISILRNELADFDYDQSPRVMAELLAVFIADTRREYCRSYASACAEMLRQPADKRSISADAVPAFVYAFLAMITTR